MSYFKRLHEPKCLADEARQAILKYVAALCEHPVSKHDEDKMKHARSLHNAIERVTADYP